MIKEKDRGLAYIVLLQADTEWIAAALLLGKEGIKVYSNVAKSKTKNQLLFTLLNDLLAKALDSEIKELKVFTEYDRLLCFNQNFHKKFNNFRKLVFEKIEPEMNNAAFQLCFTV